MHVIVIMFLLFGGEDYYPRGGIADFRGRFDTVEEAEHFAKNVISGKCEWCHIVSSETLKIVAYDDKDDWVREVNARIAKHLAR